MRESTGIEFHLYFLGAVGHTTKAYIMDGFVAMRLWLLKSDGSAIIPYRRGLNHAGSKWTVDFKNEQKDALDIFKRSFQLFKEITGIGLADAGRVKVSPLLLKLFEKVE